MLNSKVMHEQARELARALLARHGNDVAAVLDEAWNRALGRAPNQQETGDAIAMISRLAQKGVAIEDRLTQLVVAILSLNEFAYVD